MHRRFDRLLAALTLSLAATHATAAAPTLMRFPSSGANGIAFVARGDLWLAPRDGGQAARLVRSDGQLVAARFSPDGRWIAYTQRARGGQDVYVVDANGGAPRRVTFDARPGAEGNLVLGWTPDSRRVVFLSNREGVARKQFQAFTVAREGGLATRLPLDQSGTLAWAPDGRTIAFTRTFTDLASRKRYVGGQAEDLYLFDVASRRTTRVTDWKGTDTAPMWAGRRLYFLSDRGAGFRLNLWRYDLDTRAFAQVTHFADFDVDVPAIGAGRITFQQGGRLWALDLGNGAADERLHAIDVDVPDDGRQSAPRTVRAGAQARAGDVTGAVDYALAGQDAIVGAHGDLFRVSLADGTAIDLTATPGVNEQHPSASPDGRSIAYVTDDDKAQQIAVRPLAGGPARQLTRFDTGVLYRPRFSPDGRWLAVASAEHVLWLVPVAGGAPRRVAFDPKAEIRDAAFSPDGRWLAYSTQRTTGQSSLHAYAIDTGVDTVLSTALESDRLPAFSADGRTLYFVSRRHERVLVPDRGDEATLATIASDGLYALALPAPAPVRARMPVPAPASAPVPDPSLANAMAGAHALPVAGGRIVSLEVRGAELFYETRPVDLLAGDEPDARARLHAFDPHTGRDRVALDDLDGHVLSEDGRLALFRRDGAWMTQDMGPGAAGTARRVDLGGIALRVDPRAEWRAMFDHAWRLDRDLFFSRVMNGSDWQAVHDAYAKLVPLVGSHEDMLYLLRQLQGELATSHAFIGGLDAGELQPPLRTARLGADFRLDEQSGRYVLARAYAGDPTRDRFRAPLNAPATGVRVAAGSFVLAIDGQPLHAPADPDSLLAGKTGAVTLTIAATPAGPTREVVVTPVDDDLDLRQHAWVEANRARVDALSHGRIGYLFVSDFAALGAQDLMRQLQGQLDKDGLVIDVRWNGGGFTSQAVLDLLRRVHAGSLVNRERAIEPLPLFVAPRAMAVVTNESTASDGDQFAHYFRAYGLGPVVGQRTWGGVQGIKGLFPLMDGTGITIPKDSLASTDGHWLIENVGVAPDIAVEAGADDLVSGHDRSLAMAVEAVLARITARPEPVLKAPGALPAYPEAGDVPGATFGADSVPASEKR